MQSRVQYSVHVACDKYRGRHSVHTQAPLDLNIYAMARQQARDTYKYTYVSKLMPIHVLQYPPLDMRFSCLLWPCDANKYTHVLKLMNGHVGTGMSRVYIPKQYAYVVCDFRVTSLLWPSLRPVAVPNLATYVGTASPKKESFALKLARLTVPTSARGKACRDRSLAVFMLARRLNSGPCNQK